MNAINEHNRIYHYTAVKKYRMAVLRVVTTAIIYRRIAIIHHLYVALPSDIAASLPHALNSPHCTLSHIIQPVHESEDTSA